MSDLFSLVSNNKVITPEFVSTGEYIIGFVYVTGAIL